MKANMGTIDRIVRTAIALVVAALIVTGQVTGIISIVLGILAVVFVGTSLISFCPLYVLFGISTCPRKTA
jgi:Protein of unknown function (DUF2892)